MLDGSVEHSGDQHYWSLALVVTLVTRSVRLFVPTHIPLHKYNITIVRITLVLDYDTLWHCTSPDTIFHAVIKHYIFIY